FFFSSRRRHTRFSRDWSSDVCSSDLVLDAEIADNAHLLGAVRRIKSVSPLTRILIFSELDETVYGPKYLAFGTNGFLAKNADVDDIVLAIETALRGEVFHAENEQPQSAPDRTSVA